MPEHYTRERLVRILEGAQSYTKTSLPLAERNANSYGRKAQNMQGTIPVFENLIEKYRRNEKETREGSPARKSVHNLIVKSEEIMKKSKKSLEEIRHDSEMCHEIVDRMKGINDAISDALKSKSPESSAKDLAAKTHDLGTRLAVYDKSLSNTYLRLGEKLKSATAVESKEEKALPRPHARAAASA